jgi:tRNA dimethylallyltransferase
MQAAVNEGRLPLLVGGTMFYFRVLQYGLPDLPSADEAVRQRLLDEAAEHGWSSLYQRLQRIDPRSAQRINSRDRQRIQRALEIYELTGVPASDHRLSKRQTLPCEVVKIGIWPTDRSVLHARISLRLEQMFKQGFVEEVEKLHRRPELQGRLPSMRAVGYRQVIDYLEGRTNYDAMRERCVYATRQLAKRQLTWLRHDSEINWFDTEGSDFTEKVLDFLQKTTTVERYAR